MTTTEIREYRHTDDATRQAWGQGPWLNEPDKIHWIDEATGLDCLMHRHPSSGHWCGYVGVAEGHPAFTKEYDDVDVEVHGGLTYSDFCQETKCEEEGVCHVPFAGRPERVWWLGFDFAHSGDLSPAWASREEIFSRHSVYRDRACVENECRKLAAQLHGFADVH